MAELIVEVHVPLVPATGLAADAYPFPWIDDVEADEVGQGRRVELGAY
ncbi:hypothetical protein [Micromonospora sp. WMMD980]|nr:hypothetical protein [Micromonospora sp. WMMD980]MDG4804543.1 hypothetical protein [Micromonospora sp. WMMD980]